MASKLGPEETGRSEQLSTQCRLQPLQQPAYIEERREQTIGCVDYGPVLGKLHEVG